MLAVSAADYVAGLGCIAAVTFASRLRQITATHSPRSRERPTGIIRRSRALGDAITGRRYRTRRQRRSARVVRS
jgi:hypothetical protein